MAYFPPHMTMVHFYVEVDNQCLLGNSDSSMNCGGPMHMSVYQIHPHATELFPSFLFRIQQ